MPSYKELRVWSESVALVESIYLETRSLPPEEKFGLTSQIRRAAVSIPANISEGHGRSSKGDFRRFVLTAQGSAAEVETLLIIIQRLGFLPEDSVLHLAESIAQIRKMLHGLADSLV